MNNRDWLNGLAKNAPDELTAWFDAEHNDGLAAENGVSDLAVDANDGDTALDSRDKLEADVRQRLIRPSTQIDCTYGDVTRWLDRQAEITRKAEQGEWIKQANGLIHEADMRAERLQKRVDELTAERDELNAERAELEAESADYNEQIDWLRAERDRYRAMCGQMLDAAHEIRRIADANMPEGGKAAIA